MVFRSRLKRLYEIKGGGTFELSWSKRWERKPRPPLGGGYADEGKRRSNWRTCDRFQPQILQKARGRADLPVLRACEKEIGRRFGDDPFHSICMRSIDPGICSPIAQVFHTSVHVLKALVSGGGCYAGSIRGFSRAAAILNVKDSHFSVARGRDQSPIIGMRHELDGEDVGGMACCNGCGKGEW